MNSNERILTRVFEERGSCPASDHPAIRRQGFTLGEKGRWEYEPENATGDVEKTLRAEPGQLPPRKPMAPATRLPH